MPTLSQRLAECRCLLTDGAMGTNLQARGLALSDPPELWLDLCPSQVAAVHRSFVDAGADIILTNSFGANARRLKLHQLHTRTDALNRRAAAIAREVAGSAMRPVVVAGSVGPTGETVGPGGTLTDADAIDVFAAQMSGLKTGGVDVIWIETMSTGAELRAAAKAATAVAMPYGLTASFHAAQFSPEMFVALIGTLEVPPVAIGANCGLGPGPTLDAVRAIAAADLGIPIIAKGNAGLPTVSGDKVSYPVSEAAMAAMAASAIQSGARIVGGCCGTTPEAIAAMREHVLRA